MRIKNIILSAASSLLFAVPAIGQTAETFKQPYALGQQLPGNNNFTGDVWLSTVSKEDSLHLPMVNVTFAPGCINSWHYHTGGQVLVATAGTGYYQEKGKPARRLHPGDIVEIAPGTIHWHGAAPDSWFAHLALRPNMTNNETVWLQPVGEKEYNETVSKSLIAVQALTSRQQAIVAIASYTGRGDLEHLPSALTKGLKAGMTVNEIKEVLVQAYAYCGFPRSLRAIQTFMQVLDQRKADGIVDEEGRTATETKDKGDKYDRGAAILEQLSGVKSSHPQSGYGAFAPTIDKFLKEHLFADIFERDLLTYQERELATVSFIAGVGNVEPMAFGHMSICLHIGITRLQLSALLDIVENNLGRSASNPLRKVLESIKDS